MSASSTRPSGPDRPRAAGDGAEDALLALKGVGPSRRGLLADIGINSLADALLHLPVRYEDRRFVQSLSAASDNVPVALRGTVESSRTFRGGGRAAFEVTVTVAGQALRARWFHARGMSRSPLFRPGTELALYGTVGGAPGLPSMMHPDVEETDGAPSVNFGRMVPVYRSVEGLSQRVLRRIMDAAVTAALPEVREALPEGMAVRLGLPTRREAFAMLHRPAAGIALAELQSLRSPWRSRLAFEELLLLQLGLIRRRIIEEAGGKAARSGQEGPLVPKLLEGLDFSLTKAQQRVYEEIAADLSARRPMRRLLQGDVGSGKTVIAALAVCRTVAAGGQAAMMVPTELLAQQHAAAFREMLTPLGVAVSLLAAGEDERSRAAVRDGLASGKTNFVVGTHALIQEAVAFRRLHLAIIDEQHRFGVRQRLALKNKGAGPDLLAMTATPIPRTLCLACYGDFDLSVLDELPPGRRPVRTEVRGEEGRGALMEEIGREIEGGHRVFLVLPAVEEDRRRGLKAAVETARRLQRDVFPDVNVALLHGRMDPAERKRAMEGFRRGDTPLLVATTVIEVGVDVPEATLLVIEQADRFGLSQLHQLRGRVGRGKRQSRCVLMVSPGAGAEALERLRIIAAENDGFRIAEADLALRGPGDFLGTRQSGVPPLRVADLAAHGELLREARREAEDLLARDSRLSATDHAELRCAVNAMWRGKFHLAAAG